jgi:NADPH2:quinone reductase
MNGTTHALVVTSNGGTDVLRIEPRPVTEPGPGRVQVAVAAAGVNFIDVYQRQGIYPVPTPFVAGNEGAGTVQALGPDVVGLSVGDRVAWASQPGSAAGAAVLDAAAVVPVPDNVELAVAAAAMLQGMTAHYLVNSAFKVGRGDRVLIHAAAGGVGQLLIQLAKARGAWVAGTVSTDGKAEIAAAAGADAVIRYGGDLAAAVRAAAGGAGMNVVYDGVGRDTFEASLASLGRRGMLVLFGGSSGQVPLFDLQRLNAGGSLFLTRPNLRDYTATRAELLLRSGEVLSAVADGSLKIAVGGRYPLADAARAYDDLEGRRTTGKLLLIP